MRRAILSLGRYSRWQRSELREMQPGEFAAYFETAEELIDDANGN